MTTTPSRKWPIWPWVVLAVSGIAITAVSAFAGAAATSERDAPATTGSATVTVTQMQTRITTVTQTVTASASASPASDQGGPDGDGQVEDGQVEDGLFDVGSDIEPGTYRTDGPDGTNRTGCYWTRLDSAGELVANGKLTRPGTVTLVAGERFDTAGCRPWALVS
jgi:hypothetical protein